MTLYRFFLPLFAIVSVFSCKKEVAPPYYPITDEKVIASMQVKEGSYFVYLDSVNNKEDSLYVTSYRRYEDTRISKTDPIREFIKYKATGSGTLQNMEVGAFGPIPPRNRHYIGGSFNYPSSFGGTFYTAPFKAGATEYDSNSNRYYFKTEFLNVHSSYTVSGTSHDEVYEVRSSVTDPSANYFISVHTFYALNDGLIRMVVEDSNGTTNVYNLVREKIIR